MVRWRGRQESDNIDDRRGQGGGGFPFPFPGRGRRGGMRIPMGRGRGGGMGLGTLLIIGAVMWFVFGINPIDLLRGGVGGGPARQIDQTGGSRQSAPRFDIPGLPGSRGSERQARRPSANRPSTGGSSPTDDQAKFVSVIFNDTEDVWKRLFPTFGKSYREPNLVLFRGSTQTGCGPGSAQMGPFYCPLDQNIYIDLSFFNQLARQFGAPGDFAQAYVIAHEVGHHVQALLGIAEAVQRAKARSSRTRSNAIQVGMELQADCLAGIWANHADRAKQILEPGDIEEGLNAAAQIGDDMIQKRAGQSVTPHNFTHGSAKQRQYWFKTGYQSGNMAACDTFNSGKL